MSEKILKEKKFSEIKFLYKYVVIILAINTKLQNYITVINILNNPNDPTKHGAFIKQDISLSSQSPDTSLFSNDDIMDFLDNNSVNPYKQRGFTVHTKDKFIKKAYKKTKDNYKNIKKYFDSFNAILDKLKRTLALLYDLIIRNIEIFQCKVMNKTNRDNDKIIVDNDIKISMLNNKILELNDLINSIKDREITIHLIEKFYEEIDEFESIISPFSDYSIFTFKLKPLTTVKDFQKGYKDFKRWLRYLKIIKDLRTLLAQFSEGEETITYKSIISPKSSLRSYKSSYKKDLSANRKRFNSLQQESLSAIKSSPKYSTFYAEK
jgi:hypothetical protein